MKTLFQNTLIFLIILLLVSCKAVELRPDTSSSSSSSPPSTHASNIPPRIIAFEAEPPFVPEGSSMTLNWKTDNATDVHISGIGRVSPSGQRTISNSASDNEDIILTASNNSGSPPATKILPRQIIVFSTKAPPGIPLNTPVYALADKIKLRNYKKTYHFKALNRTSGLKPSYAANSQFNSRPQLNSRPGSINRVKPLPQAIHTAVPVAGYNYSSRLPAPQLLRPLNQSRFSYYPRKLTLRWKPVANAKSYIVEVDCLNCCAPRKWCTDVGKTYRRVPSLTSTQYSFQFVGAQAGRWRVQAVDKNGKAGKPSQWYNFVFTR